MGKVLEVLVFLVLLAGVAKSEETMRSALTQPIPPSFIVIVSLEAIVTCVIVVVIIFLCCTCPSKRPAHDDEDEQVGGCQRKYGSLSVVNGSRPKADFPVVSRLQLDWADGITTVTSPKRGPLYETKIRNMDTHPHSGFQGSPEAHQSVQASHSTGSPPRGISPHVVPWRPTSAESLAVVQPLFEVLALTAARDMTRPSTQPTRSCRGGEEHA
ncbi:uncharacterized protein LOC110976141 isoform X1 [Acanthaster planci]|uniref:Uncharacterized protein LOC110976141 isoform X1 n=1 Tax=Acanthaster planci TaxID=133434 RepID=A0A8B7XVI9_ACAPL|nr:uncharacterized protein LOC110976141 isoform X1 [Acanthaster planci]